MTPLQNKNFLVEHMPRLGLNKSPTLYTGLAAVPDTQLNRFRRLETHKRIIIIITDVYGNILCWTSLNNDVHLIGHSVKPACEICTLSLRMMALTLLCNSSQRRFPSFTIVFSLQAVSVRFSRARRRYCLFTSSSCVRRSWTCRWKACVRVFENSD